MAEIDRSRLPIRRAPFQGVANRTLEGSQPDWNLIGHPTPPDGAPNVLLVLIDDAGFGNPAHVRRSHQHAELHPPGRAGPSLQPLPRHGAVLADAGGAADRPEQPRGRLRLGRRVRGRLPGLLRDAAAGLRSAASHPAGQRLQHGRVRQVAPHARRPARSGRAVRPLAERLGLRLLLRLPRRRREPVGSVPGGEPEDHRHAGGVLRRGRPLLPSRMRWPTRRSSGSTACGPRTRRSRSSPTSRRAAATRRTTWRASGRTSTRASSTRAGTGSARRPSPGRRHSASIPADAELTPRDEAFPAWDDVPAKLKPFYARQMEVYAGLLGERRLQRRPRDRRDRGAGRARQHADPLDLGRQRRQHGGHDHRLVQRADHAERHPADRRDAAAAHGALRWDRGLGRPPHGSALRRRLGLGRQHPVQVGQAGRLTPRRHSEPAGGPLAGTDHRRGRAALTVRARDRHRPDHPRHRGHPGADPRRRHRAGTDARHALQQESQRRSRARASHAAVLRDHRQPGDVQGRLVAGGEDRAHPVGPHSRSHQALRSWGVGPRRRSGGALLPARRLHAGEGSGTRAAGEGQGAQGALLARGRALQSAAAARDALHLLRHAATVAGDHQARVQGRRAERALGDDPAHLQPLLRDQRRPRGARRRRRGRHRRGGRSPRRVLALRPGRKAHAHLLDDGRLRLPARSRTSRCPRER